MDRRNSRKRKIDIEISNDKSSGTKRVSLEREDPILNPTVVLARDPRISELLLLRAAGGDKQPGSGSNFQPESVINQTKEMGDTVAPGTDKDFGAKDKFRKLLNDKIHPDYSIISTDGKEFPCHKAILALSVPYLRELLAETGVSDHFQMTEEMAVDAETVDALLRFIYYNDTSSMNSSAMVTCAMIRVGVFINCTELIETGFQFLSLKDPLSDFENAVDELYRLRKLLITHQPTKYIPQILKVKVSGLITRIGAKLFGVPSG